MHLVQVFGAGCPKCVETAEVIKKECEELGIDIMLEKVSDINMITAMGILRTPGIMVDGELKMSGNIPKPEQIKSWFEEAK